MHFDPVQLKGALGKLITDVHAIHRGASGALRLADLAALLNLPLDANLQRLLNERGTITFVPAAGPVATVAGAPGAGRFENRGTEIKVNAPVATIIFPPLIAGGYLSTPHTLDIRFDASATIMGKKMMLSAPVESLYLEPRLLVMKVGGPLGSMLSRTVQIPPDPHPPTEPRP